MPIKDGMLAISDKEHYELTARFFESAAQSSVSGWQNAYEHLSKIISAGPGTIHFRHKADNYFDPIADSNPPGFIERFNSLYWHLLPYKDKFVNLRAGEKFLRTRDCPDERFINSELFRDHFERLDIYEVLHYCLFDDDRFTGGITFTRSRSKGEFTGDEKRFVREMVPYIQRAARLHLKILEANHGNRVLMEAWNRIPEGVVLVKKDGTAVFFNRSAEELFKKRESIHLDRKGVLMGQTPEESNQLRKAILGVFKDTTKKRNGFGGDIQFDRANGQSPINLRITPFKEQDRYSLQSDKFAMVLITNTDRPAMYSELDLKHKYGLTKAETRIAKLLAEGHSLSAICEKLGVAQNTARTHLKHIFGKTDTHRQSSLVKLLVSGNAS